MRYTRVNGLGNTFCIFEQGDALDWTKAQWSSLAVEVCGSAGVDGILVVGPGESKADCVTVASMRIINADGSSSEMCGNGLRAVGLLLAQQGRARVGGSQGFVIETGAGMQTLRIDQGAPGIVRTTLGRAAHGAAAVGAVGHPDDPEWSYLVSVGNPHAIVLVEAQLTAAALESRGRSIEQHESFPARINAQFAQITSREAITLQTWERGAGATAACGTGAAATVAALHHVGLVDRSVVVSLPGGDLTIEIDESGMCWQQGPAEIESVGEWPIG